MRSVGGKIAGSFALALLLLGIIGLLAFTSLRQVSMPITGSSIPIR